MIKNSLYLMVMSMLISLAVHAQTINSIANGLYYFPTTWDCMCIPSQSMDININHQVTLNNNLGMTSGSITIGASGALVQDGTLRSGQFTSGTFTNNGQFNIDRLNIQGGTFINGGTANIRAYANYTQVTNNGSVLGTDTLYNMGTYVNNGTLDHAVLYTGASLQNNGTITLADSLYNAGTLSNAVGAVIDCDSLYNANVMINDGAVQHVAFTNAGNYTNNGIVNFNAMTNIGTFDNHGQLMGTWSMTNAAVFNNHTDGTVNLDVSLLNSSLTMPPLPVAEFTNHGTVTIGDSWYNFESVTGGPTGSWTVQDSSVNYGSMTGSFSFCDLTPQSLNFPVIDFNFGMVDPTVNFCQLVGTDAMESGTRLLLFPNPARDVITVRLPAQHASVSIALCDMKGRPVLPTRTHRPENGALRIEVGTLPCGLYAIRWFADGAAGSEELVVE